MIELDPKSDPQTGVEPRTAATNAQHAKWRQPRNSFRIILFHFPIEIEISVLVFVVENTYFKRLFEFGNISFSFLQLFGIFGHQRTLFFGQRSIRKAS